MAALPHPKPILAITMGDPAGIGPEIIVKALQLPKVWRVCRPLIIGSRPILERTIHSLNTSLVIASVEGHEESTAKQAFRRGRLPLFDPCSQPVQSIKPGRVSAKAGEMAVTCIQSAVRLAQAGCVSGMVTAPINKEAMHLAGHVYPGHTEMLTHLTKAKETLIAQPRQYPAFNQKNSPFNLGFIFRFTRSRGNNRRIVMASHIAISAVDRRIVKTGLDNAGLQIVADHLNRHATEELKGPHMG